MYSLYPRFLTETIYNFVIPPLPFILRRWTSITITYPYMFGTVRFCGDLVGDGDQVCFLDECIVLRCTKEGAYYTP